VGEIERYPPSSESLISRKPPKGVIFGLEDRKATVRKTLQFPFDIPQKTSSANPRRFPYITFVENGSFFHSANAFMIKARLSEIGEYQD
jgi:hypothetical protein